MTSILDPSFKYIPAIETDLRRTFRRARRQMSTQAHHDINKPHGMSPARLVNASSLANWRRKATNEDEDSASPGRRERRVMPL
jgi:hypothetical protein